jgi:hypothetical protein
MPLVSTQSLEQLQQENTMQQQQNMQYHLDLFRTARFDHKRTKEVVSEHLTFQFDETDHSSEVNLPDAHNAEALFSTLSNKINSNDKNQKQYLSAMFLKIILSKNVSLFRELIEQLDIYEPLHFEQQARLLGLYEKAPLAILDSPILDHIQKELAKKEVKQLVSLLLHVFQSIPEFSKDKSGICIHMREKKN